MNEKFIRLENNPGAVVNIDNEGLRAYKIAKKRAVDQKQEINTIKQELSELKSLMSQILEKLK